jgi:hypothetical protein
MKNEHSFYLLFQHRMICGLLLQTVLWAAGICSNEEIVMLIFLKKVFKRENTLALLLITAALLGLIGIPQRIGISTEQLILALLGILAVDTLTERIGYLAKIEEQVLKLGIKIETKISADDVFRSRAELPNFVSLLEVYEEIWVSGVSLFGLVESFGKKIEEATQKGKKFRFLMVDPENSEHWKIGAISSYTFPSPSDMQQLSRNSLKRFNSIAEHSPKGSIEIKVADYFTPVTYVIADGNKPHGQISVEFYGFRISSSERYHLLLKQKNDDRLFTFHLGQFEKMWKYASDIPI